MVDGVNRCMVERTSSTDQSTGAATVSESRLAGPPAVALVSRTWWVPAARVVSTAAVAQAVQPPLGAKPGVPAAAPSTVTAAGRSSAVPLAYRKSNVTAPVAGTVTVHST